MNWFYVSGGQATGPVPEAEFELLVQARTVRAETLVWHEGMAEWQPYGKTQPKALALAMAPSPPAPSTPSEPVPATFTGDEVVCAECGGIFPRAQTIRLGDRNVCPACKPIHVQKLKEGLPTGGVGLLYAGFWIRAAAKVLDAIILTLAGALLIGSAFAVLIPAAAANPDSAATFMLLLIFVAGSLALGIFVFLPIWCVAKYGGTPGKRICRLRIVTATGAPVGWGRAIGRFFAEMLTGLIPLWIGYIIAAFDPEKRTVHDHICNTRVVQD
jgi:uncharacterized RDD family membrane protein YckC